MATGDTINVSLPFDEEAYSSTIIVDSVGIAVVFINGVIVVYTFCSIV